MLSALRGEETKRLMYMFFPAVGHMVWVISEVSCHCYKPYESLMSRKNLLMYSMLENSSCSSLTDTSTKRGTVFPSMSLHSDRWSEIITMMISQTKSTLTYNLSASPARNHPLQFLCVTRCHSASLAHPPFIVPSAPKHKFLSCGFIPTIVLRFVEFILLFNWLKPWLTSRSKQLLEVHFQCKLLSFLFSTKLPSSTDPASLCLTTQQAIFFPLCRLQHILTFSPFTVRHVFLCLKNHFWQQCCSSTQKWHDISRSNELHTSTELILHLNIWISFTVFN